MLPISPRYWKRVSFTMRKECLNQDESYYKHFIYVNYKIFETHRSCTVWKLLIMQYQKQLSKFNLFQLESNLFSEVLLLPINVFKICSAGVCSLWNGKHYTCIYRQHVFGKIGSVVYIYDMLQFTKFVLKHTVGRVIPYCCTVCTNAALLHLKTVTFLQFYYRGSVAGHVQLIPYLISGLASRYLQMPCQYPFIVIGSFMLGK